jgi:hypothetical protein
MKIILIVATILMVWSLNAAAQQGLVRRGSEPAVERLRAERVGYCVADLRRLCPGAKPGNNALRTCMREHLDDVSSPCLMILAKFAEVRRSLRECSAHLYQQCASVERGGGLFGPCLKSAVASLSDACKIALTQAVHGR